jgi:hypothetical protein
MGGLYAREFARNVRAGTTEDYYRRLEELDRLARRRCNDEEWRWRVAGTQVMLIRRIIVAALIVAGCFLFVSAVSVVEDAHNLSVGIRDAMIRLRFHNCDDDLLGCTEKMRRELGCGADDQCFQPYFYVSYCDRSCESRVAECSRIMPPTLDGSAAEAWGEYCYVALTMAYKPREAVERMRKEDTEQVERMREERAR